MSTKRFSGFRSSDLHIMAMIFMLIDHVGYIMMNNNIIMRLIGRLAFPLFCFLLVQGFIHTHDCKKYLVRLLLLALVSEWPYDHVLMSGFSPWEHQNVLWTLALGLVMLMVLKTVREKNYGPGPTTLLSALVVVAAMSIARLIHCDYELLGILMIFFFYVIRPYTKKRFLVTAPLLFLLNDGLVLFARPLPSPYYLLQSFATVALFPIALYNDRPGWRSRAYRVFHYLFYPVHLLVIGLLSHRFSL